jgi:hypothetical protein
MNKTKALEIMTALTNEGVNVSLNTLFAETEDTDTEYVVTVLMPFGATLSDARPVQRVLDEHEAQLVFPNFHVMLDEEIAEEKRRQAEHERRLDPDFFEPPPRGDQPEMMASEQTGGRSADFPEPDDSEG